MMMCAEGWRSSSGRVKKNTRYVVPQGEMKKMATTLSASTPGPHIIINTRLLTVETPSWHTFSIIYATLASGLCCANKPQRWWWWWGGVVFLQQLLPQLTLPHSRQFAPSAVSPSTWVMGCGAYLHEHTCIAHHTAQRCVDEREMGM